MGCNLKCKIGSYEALNSEDNFTWTPGKTIFSHLNYIENDKFANLSLNKSKCDAHNQTINQRKNLLERLSSETART